MKRLSLATFKAFLHKNEGKLFIKCVSSFGGMTDGVEQNRTASYRPLTGIFGHSPREGQFDNTLGYHGIWLVGDIRDYFTPISENGFEGYEAYNCCGSFIVAIKAHGIDLIDEEQPENDLVCDSGQFGMGA